MYFFASLRHLYQLNIVRIPCSLSSDGCSLREHVLSPRSNALQHGKRERSGVVGARLVPHDHLLRSPSVIGAIEGCETRLPPIDFAIIIIVTLVRERPARGAKVDAARARHVTAPANETAFKLLASS